jgi:hypothetical protein
LLASRLTPIGERQPRIASLTCSQTILRMTQSEQSDSPRSREFERLAPATGFAKLAAVSCQVGFGVSNLLFSIGFATAGEAQAAEWGFSPAIYSSLTIAR